MRFRKTNPLDDLQVNMDDRNIAQNLTTRLDANEDLDWYNLQNSDLYRALAAKLKSHVGKTSFYIWKKSQKPEEAKHADSLAKSALTHPQQQEVNTDISPSLLIRGQRLQRSFYQHLVKLHIERHYSPKIETKANLAAIQFATKELWNMTPTPHQLWKSIRSRDIPKNTQNFLWKSLHSSYKVGSYWSNIPNYEDRGICRLCGESESIHHILVYCEPSIIRRTVLELASEWWCKREDTWPDISFGSILGANLPNSANTKSAKKKAATGYLLS